MTSHNRTSDKRTDKARIFGLEVTEKPECIMFKFSFRFKKKITQLTKLSQKKIFSNHKLCDHKTGLTNHFNLNYLK